MSWTNNYKHTQPKQAEAGDHRVEIVEAKFDYSKSGKNMIVVTVKPNGSSAKITTYIVEGEFFDGKMSDLFDSFGITPGDFDLQGWIGAVGAAKLKPDDRDDRYLKVSYFLSKKKQESLPPWEGAMPERMTVNSLQPQGGGYEEEAAYPTGDDEALPWER